MSTLSHPLDDFGFLEERGYMEMGGSKPFWLIWARGNVATQLAIGSTITLWAYF